MGDLMRPASMKAASRASANSSPDCFISKAQPGLIAVRNVVGDRTDKPARSKAGISSSANRRASLSAITIRSSTLPVNGDSLDAIRSRCSYVTCLSAKRSSSFTRARFASAAACSAWAARSRSSARDLSAISLSLVLHLWRCISATNSIRSPIATAAPPNLRSREATHASVLSEKYVYKVAGPYRELNPHRQSRRKASGSRCAGPNSRA